MAFDIKQKLEAETIHQNSLNLFKENKLLEGLDMITEAINLYPTFEHAIYNRGIMEQALNNYKNAILNFNTLIELNPKHIDAYFSRAINYLFDKEYTKAIDDFNFVISMNSSLNPPTNNPWVNYTLENAKKYLFKSKCEIALKSFQQDNIVQTVKIFEEVIRDNKNIGSGVYAEIYLISKLKLHIPDLNIIHIPDLNINSLYLNNFEITENNSTFQIKSPKNDNFSINRNDINFGKLIEYKIDYKINFGKYSGETLEKIINSNPSEILNYIINLTHFSVSNYILSSKDFIDLKDFATAIEINLLKSKVIEIILEEKRKEELEREEAKWEREEYRDELRKSQNNWMDGDPENYWNID